MTPEQATEILIAAIARVESVKLVLATALFMAAAGVVIWLLARWVSRTERLNFYRARDAEARELCAASVDTINRMAAEGRRMRNLLLDLDDYFRRHRATFDDKEREPLVARIGEIIASRQPQLQIEFKRDRAPESEAA